MKSDWHRYNLKRKVIDLPPVTAELFAQKITKQIVVDSQPETYCLNCKKSFASENAYKNHLNSKKHREMAGLCVIAHTSEASEYSYKESIDWRDRLLNAQTEQEVENILAQKKLASVQLTELDCLFCPHKSTCFEELLKTDIGISTTWPKTIHFLFLLLTRCTISRASYAIWAPKSPWRTCAFTVTKKVVACIPLKLSAHTW